MAIVGLSGALKYAVRLHVTGISRYHIAFYDIVHNTAQYYEHAALHSTDPDI
jgi:hypothetical protein